MRRLKRWLGAITLGAALAALPAALPAGTSLSAPAAEAGPYDYVWRQSGCDPAVYIYGVPGRGSRYWTARYGEVEVFDDMYSVYAGHNWECGALRKPIKWSNGPNYMGEFSSPSWSSYGLWFQGGAIRRMSPYGFASVAWGNYGQCSGSCWG